MAGRGIDYSGPGSTANRDPKTGIRYGVMPVNRLIGDCYDEFEAVYSASCPDCGAAIGDDITFPADCQNCGWTIEDGEQYGDEPEGWKLDKDGYKGSLDSSNDAWLFKSPFVTKAGFCSPCAPGACYLPDACDEGEWCYAFGHDWFDGGVAPYPVYDATTREPVLTDQMVDRAAATILGEKP